MSEEVVKEGTKEDDGKDRYDLVPWDAMEQVARVFTLGAKKYGDRNWENGMSHGRLYAAAFRHMTAYWISKDPDDLDPDPKMGRTHHLANAACCILMLLSSLIRRIGKDDRPLSHYEQMRYNPRTGLEKALGPGWTKGDRNA